jgi:hypothetical protein
MLPIALVTVLLGCPQAPRPAPTSNKGRDHMNRTGRLAMFVAMTAVAGMAHAGSQAAAAPKKAPVKKEAGEKKLDLKSLPPAVRATVERETASATLKGLSKEVEKGKTQYEVETMANGRTRDLLVDPAGTVLEVEEQLDLDSAPAPVKAALQSRGKLLRLETVTRGTTISYEALVQAASGKKSEISLDAAGKPIKS